MNKRGFSLFLTFLVTTIVFILVSGSYEISRISLDLGRSDAIDTLVFHSADGGLERGLARLSADFSPIKFSYISKISDHRRMIVEVEADWSPSSTQDNPSMNLHSSATLFEGKHQRSSRRLSRIQINNLSDRSGAGRFTEAT